MFTHCGVKFMKIGIIDADLIGRKQHRFPNLCCMKISGYHKEQGDNVELVLDSSDLARFDKVYVAKVFTDTPDPIQNEKSIPIIKGGTGYFYDKAPSLPTYIEHHMPDYHLYDEWAVGKKNVKFYTDYSIGYLTRGCFRKCKFCVNQKYNHAFLASPLKEFLDTGRKKICLLDDNFLSYQNWKTLLEELIVTSKPFQFKQGMDERVLDEERCRMLFNAKYDGDKTFAFDDIRDYPLIEKKLQLIRKFTDASNLRFYVLCGFTGTDYQDIEGVFKRIALLFRYGAIPYIMRYQSPVEAPWKKSKWEGLYTTIARWCNQVNFVKKKSFREFCELNQKYHEKIGGGSGFASRLDAYRLLKKSTQIFLLPTLI